MMVGLRSKTRVSRPEQPVIKQFNLLKGFHDGTMYLRTGCDSAAEALLRSTGASHRYPALHCRLLRWGVEALSVRIGGGG